MIEWLTEAYIRQILNLRILFNNPTGNETVDWLRLFSLLLLAVVIVRFVLDQIASRRLRQRSRRCDDPLLTEMLARAAAGLGLKGCPALFYSGQAWPLAFSHGIKRPAIFLAPVLADRLSARELEAVVTHEAAHFSRRDSLRYWMREILWAAIPVLLIQGLAVRFIFNEEASELTWWAGVVLVLGFRLLLGPWDRLREKSCDDQTIAITGDPLSLARALVKTSRLGGELVANGWGLRSAATHALVGGGSALRGRVQRLLNYRRPWQRRAVLRLGKVGLAGLAAGYLLFSVSFHSSPDNQLLIGSIWAAPCPSVLLVD